MPKRKVTFASVARNVRRQAERRISQLERMAESARNDYVRQGIAQRIERIKEAAEGTYINNASGRRIAGRTEADRRESLQHLASELSSTRYASNRGRRNLASTQMQINLASTGQASSMYSEAEVKIFYRATQRAWQREGVSTRDRNEAILEYYGYESLSQAISDVLALNWKAVESSKVKVQEIMTKEQQEMAEEMDIKEAATYPQYLRDVISMPEPSGLAELSKA